MGTVNVFNEWDELEEVIVGIADGARVPLGDKGLHVVRYSEYENVDEIPYGLHSQRVIEETAEDLEKLAEVFKSLGVVVRRPEATDLSKPYSTPDWVSDGMYHYCPRDLFLPVGNTIIEAPMSLRSRYFDPFAYKKLFIEYLKNGARWISAPKPQLLDSIYNTTDPEKFALNDDEPVFDAANVIRLGKDLVYLVSDSGNKMGALWLQNTLGDEYRVHACDNLYNSTHIDTTITLLRAGLVLINPERVNADNLPKVFKNWEVLVSPEMVDIGYAGVAYGSEWIGMNMMMVNPNLAIVDKHQTALIKLLNGHKIDVIPVELRHSRTLGGGIHCVTLDVRRKGVLEDYS